MKIFITLIVGVFILLACSKREMESTKVIKIDIDSKNEINLPKISIESVCPLETNDSTFFGDIASIEYFSNRVYLLDMFSSKSLLEFTVDGTFVGRTIVGKGPAEMIDPYAFAVDRDDKSVLVWDQTLRTMFKYDLDLNYISSSRYNRPIQNFSIINKNEVLVYASFYKDFIYSIYSSNLDTIISQHIKDFPYSGVYGLLRPISVNKRILMIAPLDYNVYQLSDHAVQSVYYFDFGKYKLKQEECENSSISNIWELINSGQRVSSLYEIAESENFILFKVYFNRKKIFYAYSSSTGKTLRLNDFFDNGILPVCDIRGTTDKDIFYALVEPLEMIKFQKSKGLKYFEGDLSLNQNPILLRFSISAKMLH